MTKVIEMKCRQAQKHEVPVARGRGTVCIRCKKNECRCGATNLRPALALAA